MWNGLHTLMGRSVLLNLISVVPKEDQHGRSERRELRKRVSGIQYVSSTQISDSLHRSMNISSRFHSYQANKIVCYQSDGFLNNCYKTIRATHWSCFIDIVPAQLDDAYLSMYHEVTFHYKFQSTWPIVSELLQVTRADDRLLPFDSVWVKGADF